MSTHRILADLESSPLTGTEFRRAAMERLSELEGYDWSGVYRLEGDALLLDEYMGDETDHTRIPVGRGVCGTAVAENRNQIVPDVKALDNYLACSSKTKAEIVVLVRDRDGVILGQIDVDSHTTGRFDSDDEEFLVTLAELMAERW